MFQSFICGAFNHEEEEDDHELWSRSPNYAPRKSRRTSFCKRHNRVNKNPYSNGGLDKFSALLAELEEKRQEIYSQTGSQDISFVRFTYKNSSDCVPIVVKLKNKKEEEKKKSVNTKGHQPGRNADSEAMGKRPIETLIEGKEVIKKISELQSVSEKTEKNKKKKSFSWNTEFHKWRRPSYYLPAYLVLILLLLVFFGRSVSILFTSIGCYIAPIMLGESSSKVGRSMKKKDYSRKLSENKSGAARDKSSPVRDHHRRS